MAETENYMRFRHHKTEYNNRCVDADDRANTIHAAFGKLRKYRDRFDAIAVRGVSGLVIGSILADRLEKHLVVVRRPEELRVRTGIDWNDTRAREQYTQACHSALMVEGPLDWTPLARYIVVDDFTSSGNTLKWIHEAIGTRAQHVNTFLYAPNSFLFHDTHGEPTWTTPGHYLPELVPDTMRYDPLLANR